MRCYAPSTSAIAALLFIGYLALRHTAGHALASAGLVTTVIVVLGASLLAVGLTVVAAATVRRRRAAAGGCLTCAHPCQEPVEAPPAYRGRQGTQVVDLPLPEWPHRPLTRGGLPAVVVPGQREAAGAGQPERVIPVRAGTASHR